MGVNGRLPSVNHRRQSLLAAQRRSLVSFVSRAARALPILGLLAANLATPTTAARPIDRVNHVIVIYQEN